MSGSSKPVDLLGLSPEQIANIAAQDSNAFASRFNIGELLGRQETARAQADLENRKLTQEQEIASNKLAVEDAYKSAVVANEQKKITLQAARDKASIAQDVAQTAKLDSELEALNKKSEVLNIMIESGIGYEDLNPAAKAIIGSDPGADARNKITADAKAGLSDEQKRLLRNDATSAVQKMSEVNEENMGPYVQRYVDSKRALGEEVKQIPYYETTGSPNKVKMFDIPEGYTYEKLVEEAGIENMSLSEYIRELNKYLRKK